jgi:hypothetical protein
VAPPLNRRLFRDHRLPDPPLALHPPPAHRRSRTVPLPLCNGHRIDRRRRACPRRAGSPRCGRASRHRSPPKSLSHRAVMASGGLRRRLGAGHPLPASVRADLSGLADGLERAPGGGGPHHDWPVTPILLPAEGLPAPSGWAHRRRRGVACIPVLRSTGSTLSAQNPGRECRSLATNGSVRTNRCTRAGAVYSPTRKDINRSHSLLRFGHVD